MSETAARWMKALDVGIGGSRQAPLQNCRVQPLIDGVETFAAIKRAIDTATGPTHTVYFLAWWCDPWVNLAGPRTSLLDLFDRAGRAGVQIRVLIWQASALALPNQLRLNRAAASALNRIPNCHAQLDDATRVVRVNPLLPPVLVGVAKSHHQKLLIVNGNEGLITLCGGVDVNVDRVHPLPPPASAYRSDRPKDIGWEGGSGGSGSGPVGAGTPLHDVHAKVTGPGAVPLMQLFLHRWWARSGDRTIDRTHPLRLGWISSIPPPTGRQYVRVGETFNGVIRGSGTRPHELRVVTVQDIWLRAILNARRFIYIEEQYLTLPCAAEAIRLVLPRLEAEPPCRQATHLHAGQ